MLLSEYAIKKGILEQKKVTVLKIVPAGDDFTVHYRVSGQKYRSPEDVSKKTIPAELYHKLEVDENDGSLKDARVIRKANFLIWEPLDEA